MLGGSADLVELGSIGHNLAELGDLETIGGSRTAIWRPLEAPGRHFQRPRLMGDVWETWGSAEGAGSL